MTRSFLSSLALSAALVTVAEPTQVALIVTVTQGDSRYLTGLTAADFEVSENGVRQPALSVQSVRDLPIAFSFLLDTSNSMRDVAAHMKGVAAACVERLRPVDQGQLISASGSPGILEPFTSDHALLVRRIASLSVSGVTPLNTALSLGLRDLNTVDSLRSGRARSVFVVFSDGDDTSSLVPDRDVLEYVKRSQTVLYAIGPNRPGRGGSSSVLPPLVRASGGLSLWVGPRTDPAAVCDALLADLSKQYVVMYESTHLTRDGKWRDVKVKVNVSGAKVRTRAGTTGRTTARSRASTPRSRPAARR